MAEKSIVIKGTPNHLCDQGFCLGDYPQLGADHKGIYITTNEFSFFGSGNNGAQLYALPKQAPAAGASSVISVYFQNLDYKGLSSYYFWPSQSPNPISFDTRHGGTEYFLMSTATLLNVGVMSNELVVGALSNTRSLNSNNPNLTLSLTSQKVETYGDPQTLATQKAGPTPLADCLNADACGSGAPPTRQVEGPLDSGTGSGVYKAWLANSLLYTSLDTVAVVAGQTRTAVAYFVVDPGWRGNTFTSHLVGQGYLAAVSADLTYATIATNADGQGVIAFTLSGENYYPSAAYVTINRADAGRQVKIAAAGAGPQDGFTEYFIGGSRPRWGDYGAATSDGRDVWFASEYIGQSCTYRQFLADKTCGGTRTILVNWATRISKVNAGER